MNKNKKGFNFHLASATTHIRGSNWVLYRNKSKEKNRFLVILLAGENGSVDFQKLLKDIKDIGIKAMKIVSETTKVNGLRDVPKSFVIKQKDFEKFREKLWNPVVVFGKDKNIVTSEPGLLNMTLNVVIFLVLGTLWNVAEKAVHDYLLVPTVKGVKSIKSLSLISSFLQSQAPNLTTRKVVNYRILTDQDFLELVEQGFQNALSVAIIHGAKAGFEAFIQSPALQMATYGSRNPVLLLPTVAPLTPLDFRYVTQRTTSILALADLTECPAQIIGSLQARVQQQQQSPLSFSVFPLVETRATLGYLAALQVSNKPVSTCSAAVSTLDSASEALAQIRVKQSLAHIRTSQTSFPRYWLPQKQLLCYRGVSSISASYFQQKKCYYLEKNFSFSSSNFFHPLYNANGIGFLIVLCAVSSISYIVWFLRPSNQDIFLGKNTRIKKQKAKFNKSYIIPIMIQYLCDGSLCTLVSVYFVIKVLAAKAMGYKIVLLIVTSSYGALNLLGTRLSVLVLLFTISKIVQLVGFFSSFLLACFTVGEAKQLSQEQQGVNWQCNRFSLWIKEIVFPVGLCYILQQAKSLYLLKCIASAGFIYLFLCVRTAVWNTSGFYLPNLIAFDITFDWVKRAAIHFLETDEMLEQFILGTKTKDPLVIMSYYLYAFIIRIIIYLVGYYLIMRMCHLIYDWIES